MGLFDKVERKLESVVNGAFARAFRAEVQPVEIAAAMRRAMDDRAAVMGKGRTVVPNLFVIDLSPADYERLTSYAELLADELVASVQEHSEQQRYVPGGPFQIDFRSREDLETGVFRVRPATARGRGGVDDGTEFADDVDPAERYRAELQREHPFRPPEAEAPAVGAIGLASHAASAAAGSLAGTAAAGRANPAFQQPVAPGLAPDGGDRGAPPVPAAHARVPQARAPHAPAHPSPAPPPPAAHEPPVDPIERPWLECDGDHYPLLGPITVLGRDSTADISLDDGGVSRRHAEIRVTHDGPRYAITITDLGSTNGTFVNGDRITSRRVDDGDRVTVGRSSLVIRSGRR